MLGQCLAFGGGISCSPSISLSPNGQNRLWSECVLKNIIEPNNCYHNLISLVVTLFRFCDYFFFSLIFVAIYVVVVLGFYGPPTAKLGHMETES